ncbi:MAG: LptF/LptG family permease [Candidatus Omnitrophota bacterium]|nr:LptF/LptG family permease [Candidatus Omnitrophota bacterium]MBU1928585.1 LptF/LptG family permease [Candidatus Omnitrophota bacterium]MBU2034598.1 LptF/LptG family permease [Candidatus Omnitrophota bacterium]MBU2221969.1 LptF/LptG family permease [Candidatus Omnitrophota bacterium]MBU2257706.1 LptF/LptG family permease [Candidatus Omnitrophota bacterium]
MKILREYFLKEYLGPLVAALLVLTFVMILGNLVKIAELVINKGVDIYTVMKLFLFMVPALLTYTLPIATLVAVLLSLGRLSSDNEIVTIKASGINLLTLIIPLLIISLILSLILVVFNDRVIPYAHFATRKTLVEVGIKNPTAALEPGVFINSFEKYILFIYSIEQNKLHNVRIYEPQGEDKPTRIIVAKKGEFIAMPEKNILKLKLMDGTSDEPDPNNPSNFYKLNFKTYFMSLNLSQMQDKNKVAKKAKDMTINELEIETARLKKDGIDPTPLTVEIHKKLSLAFSCFVFILVGIPLAIITRRREKSLNFGIAFLIVGIYYLLLISAEALSLRGVLNPGLAMWLPDIIFGLIGSILTFRICAF